MNQDEWEKEGWLFNPDIWCGKTCREHSQATEERTLEWCLKKSQESATKGLLFLDLRKGNGKPQESLSVTDTLLRGEFLMLNIGESPSVAVESHLSQILEANPHPRYSLSARACQGILTRAERRGKSLPTILKQALTARCGTGGNNTPAVCIQGAGKTSKTSNGNGYKEEIAYTLNTVDVHGVCYSKVRNAMDSEDYETWEKSDTAHTLNTFNASISRASDVVVQNKRAIFGARGNGNDAKDPHVVTTGYIVRRLTPLECERLQGYPDDWTDIGEWASRKGKNRQTTDSARYKAMDNSIALPPWRWVLKRICAHYERNATMASLFDGVGGFPLLWEQINGKGSCLWASEIEEFPIAVTKKRFN